MTKGNQIRFSGEYFCACGGEIYRLTSKGHKVALYPKNSLLNGVWLDLQRKPRAYFKNTPKLRRDMGVETIWQQIGLKALWEQLIRGGA